MYMLVFVEECSMVCAHLGFIVHTVLGVSNCMLEWNIGCKGGVENGME